MRNRFYKLFSDSNPETVDLAIENFLADGRKLIEARHNFDIKQRVLETPAGIKLPQGMQQVEMLMSFHCILIYEGNAADLEKKKAASTSNLKLSE